MDSVRDWIDKHSMTFKLMIAFAVVIVVGLFFKPWSKYDADVVSYTMENGLQTKDICEYIFFKGIMEYVSCIAAMTDRLKTTSVSSNMTAVMLCMSILFFVLSAFLNNTIKTDFVDADTYIEKLVDGWLLDNILFSVAAYIWWGICSLVLRYNTAMVIFVIAFIISLPFIITSMLYLIGYVALLSGGFKLVDYVGGLMSGFPFILSFIILVLLSILVYALISFIVEKLLEYASK